MWLVIRPKQKWFRNCSHSLFWFHFIQPLEVSYWLQWKLLFSVIKAVPGRRKAWRRLAMVSEGSETPGLGEYCKDSQFLGGDWKSPAPRIAAVAAGKWGMGQESTCTLSDPRCHQHGTGGFPLRWIRERRISDCSKQRSRVWSRVYFDLCTNSGMPGCPSSTRIQIAPWSSFVHIPAPPLASRCTQTKCWTPAPPQVPQNHTRS